MDFMMQRWPGYTLRSAMDEDAHQTYETLTLLSIGKGDE